MKSKNNIKKTTIHNNSKESVSDELGSDEASSPKSVDATAFAEDLESAMQEVELDTELHSESSEPFIGKWNQLVSTTNWEKGRIIFDWREELIAKDAHPTQYSDEAWSKLVGGVTSQHVGRLRRVFQKFGESVEDYKGLYWSHFHAAIDWSDPELWLEGAIQNKWSVSQMRKQRWETMGQIPEDQPEDYQVITAEIDEDFEPAVNKEPKSKGEIPTGPAHEGPDFGDQENLSPAPAKDSDGSKIYADGDEEAIDFVRPFANIGELPEDLSEAFDAFKLAILHHKGDNWQQITLDDVLASLDALKELAKAPSADDATF